MRMRRKEATCRWRAEHADQINRFRRVVPADGYRTCATLAALGVKVTFGAQ